MTNSGILFSDELTKLLLDAGFPKCQTSIYYKYAIYGTNIVAYLMFMTVCIGIIMKQLENCLWIL